ncbi:hypothetical protein TUM17384_02730 [Shewanella algae]|uniref:DUF1439 domain-containing protein n=1 Tax=Shewanella algae TaxID=38313 RepID=UPI001BED834F|nr:DUF1439 domain-containing protein [Shewanella algae]BCV56328.1 hypothetical protein TUM17384_02730 [Shewanella algae]
MRLPLLLSLWLMLMLGGCVSQYSISEGRLESYLNKELQLDMQDTQGPLATEIQLNRVTVKLGHKPDTMAVKATSELILRTPLFPLRASLTTEFEAKPWYDNQTHGVYLRGLELTSVESNPKDIQRALKGIAPQLMGFIRNFLESQPVYVLDTQDSNQARLADMTKSLQVKPGKLVLEFK